MGILFLIFFIKILITLGFAIYHYFDYKNNSGSLDKSYLKDEKYFPNINLRHRNNLEFQGDNNTNKLNLQSIYNKFPNYQNRCDNFNNFDFFNKRKEKYQYKFSLSKNHLL